MLRMEVFNNDMHAMRGQIEIVHMRLRIEDVDMHCGISQSQD